MLLDSLGRKSPRLGSTSKCQVAVDLILKEMRLLQLFLMETNALMGASGLQTRMSSLGTIWIMLQIQLLIKQLLRQQNIPVIVLDSMTTSKWHCWKLSESSCVQAHVNAFQALPYQIYANSILIDMPSQLEELLSQLFKFPRQTYNIADLGCPIVPHYGRRTDFSLRGPEGIYKCSYYQPLNSSSQGDHSSHCVIYLHSLGGSRIESSLHARRFLERGMGFASLDFCGSGLSDGTKTSLGSHSAHQVIGLIEHLVQTYKVKKIVLWGRSMGSGIAIKTMQLIIDKSSRLCDRDQVSRSKTQTYQVVALVLDSPFCSLRRLILQIAEKRMSIIPRVLVRAALGLMQNSIENVANCTLADYQLIDFLPRMKVPLLILASKSDNLVSIQHSELIYKHYPSSSKQILFVEGAHTDSRDSSTQTKVLQFCVKNFLQTGTTTSSQQKQNHKISVNLSKGHKRSLFIKNQIIKKAQTLTLTQTEQCDQDFDQFHTDRQRHTFSIPRDFPHRQVQAQRNSVQVRSTMSPLSKVLTKPNLDTLKVQDKICPIRRRMPTPGLRRQAGDCRSSKVQELLYGKRKIPSRTEFRQSSFDQCKGFLC